MLEGRMIPERLSRHLKGPIARGSIGTLALMVGGAGLTFLVNVVLARLLGPSGFGAYAFAAGWLGLLGLPAAFGFNHAIIRMVAQGQVHEEWGAIRGLLRFTDGFAGVAGLTLAATAAAGFWAFGAGLEPEMRAAALIGLAALPFLALSQMRQGALTGLHHAVLARAPDLLLQPASLLILMPVAAMALDGGLDGPRAAALLVASMVLAWLVGAVALRRRLPGPIREAKPRYEPRRWLAVALPFTFIAGMAAINAQTDVVMLGMLAGSEATGVYRVASRISDLAGFPILAIGIPLAPAVAALYAASRREELQLTVTKGARAATLAALPVALVLVLAGPWILALFGPAFPEGQWALTVLAGGKALEALLGPVGVLLAMTNQARPAAAAVGLGAAANVALNLLLIPRFGIEGAAVATTISIFVRSAIMVALARRALAIRPTVLGTRPRHPGRWGWTQS